MIRNKYIMTFRKPRRSTGPAKQSSTKKLLWWLLKDLISIYSSRNG
jgi:hypothetical protein